MKGTSIPYRRVETTLALARHARHSQARFMNLSLAPRPFGRLLYLRVQLFLLGCHLRNSSSIRLSQIRCPWWNIPPRPPVQRVGLILGQQARRVTVMNYSLVVMQRAGPVRTTTVGHKQRVFPDGYSIRTLSSWSYINVAITPFLGISPALHRFFQEFCPCFIQGAFVCHIVYPFLLHPTHVMCLQSPSLDSCGYLVVALSPCLRLAMEIQ